MSSVLLVYPYFNSPRNRSIFRFPPLGVAYVAASLRKDGHDVQVLDCTFMERQDALDRAEHSGAQVVGIYSMVNMRRDSLDFARHLQGKCDLLVAGGPLPSCDMASFAGDFDVVVAGEGEHTAVELLDAFCGKRSFVSVDGILQRNGHDPSASPSEYVPVSPREMEPDLNALNFPARDLLPNTGYIDYWKRKSGQATTTIITTRGCPFNCEFCSNAVFGVSYRERSAENVVDEVEQALSLGYERVHFADDVFTLNRERVFGICREIRRRRLHFQWECLGRVDSIDEKLTKEMKVAGCDRMFFGIESGNDSVLKLMRKKIDIARAARAVKTARDAGLKAGAFFIVCYPGETNSTVLETLRFATSLPLNYLSFTMPYPLPGTALRERVKDRRIKEWAGGSGPVLEHSLIFDSDFSEAKMKFAILKGRAQFGLRRNLGGAAFLAVKPFEIMTDTVFRLMT